MSKRQEIIDRIPVHKNIHKSDIVAYCDDNLSHAQTLYFPLGFVQFKNYLFIF